MEKNIIDIANDILKQVDIVEVISRYISLQKKGRNYIGLCPFHDDKNLGNFSVNPEKQIYKCFSCNAGGTAITFVMKKENISFREALNKICEMFSIAKPAELSSSTVVVDPQIEENLKCLETSYSFYSTSLFNSKEGEDALGYLSSRGLDKDTINYFKIGYAQNDGTLLVNYLKKKNFSLKTMDSCGLIRIDDNPIKDINSGRIVFAITNRNNKIIGYSARIFKGQSDAKYVNTRDTILFNKSTILYNYANAISEAKKFGYVYLLEGFMDVIACYRVGIKSAIALMGTALTKEHIQMLRYLNVEVRLCLDLDNPGQKNMYSIIKNFDKYKIPYRLVNNVTTYSGKDSDEILKNHGKDGLLDFLNNLISKGEWILNYLCKNLDLYSLDGRKKLVTHFIPIINSTNDKLDKEAYLVKLSELSKFSIENLTIIANSTTNKDLSIKEATNLLVEPQNKNLTRLERCEINLMHYILEHKEALNIYKKSALILSNPKYYEIIQYIYAFIRENNEYNIINLMNYIELHDDEGSKFSKDILRGEITHISNIKVPDYSDENMHELISNIKDEIKAKSEEEITKDLLNGKSDEIKLEVLKQKLKEKDKNLKSEEKK